MIKGKIDCLKIDKARLFVGQKGKYLDFTLIETPNDQYGNAYMIVQDVTKEERLAGVKGAILGNAKIVGQRPAQAPAANPTPKPAQQRPAAAAPDDSDDIAF